MDIEYRVKIDGSGDFTYYRGNDVDKVIAAYEFIVRLGITPRIYRRRVGPVEEISLDTLREP